MLDLAAVCDTLIADHDGVYHPRQFNDRLLLGLKGTMSEAELHILEVQRLEEGGLGKWNGERTARCCRRDWDGPPTGGVEKDPDERGAEHRVGAGKIRRIGELRAGVALPAAQNCCYRAASRMEQCAERSWKPPTDTAIYEIVRNPAYAGAFVWAKAPQPGQPPAVRGRRPQEEWIAIVCDVYPAYITWAQYGANQAQLVRNGQRTGGADLRRGRNTGRSLVCCKDWRCADTAATIVG
ncbi:recombinase family protein [Candidatus Amarolinea dominans]|uniref:recombinase family protein n=1 Tax=Candidatus Amarolinea dominans TaxID=3140696 RepID=UPI001D6274B3|nr:recombinase family protein [Anaerolineae bacterium]